MFNLVLSVAIFLCSKEAFGVTKLTSYIGVELGNSIIGLSIKNGLKSFLLTPLNLELSEGCIA
jgi:hypothetical protein